MNFSFRFAVTLATIAFALHGIAAEPAPITAPTLHEPLGKEWSVSKGKWEVKDGVLVVTDIPEEKHVPVLHLATGPTNLTAECDFRFNNGNIFYIGCDAQRHVAA